MEVWASQEAKSHPGVMLLQEGGREGGAEVRSATFAGVKREVLCRICSAGNWDEL